MYCIRGFRGVPKDVKALGRLERVFSSARFQSRLFSSAKIGEQKASELEIFYLFFWTNTETENQSLH